MNWTAYCITCKDYVTHNGERVAWPMRIKRICQDDKHYIALFRRYGTLENYETDCNTIGLWADNPLNRLNWERAKKAHTRGTRLKKEGGNGNR